MGVPTELPSHGGASIGVKDPATWGLFDKLSFSWVNKWVTLAGAVARCLGPGPGAAV
jgi:hypothetical protein